MSYNLDELLAKKDQETESEELKKQNTAPITNKSVAPNKVLPPAGESIAIKKNHLMIGGVLAAILAIGVFAKNSGENTANASETTEQTQKLPDGVKKLSKLPFDAPAFFKNPIVEVYKVGSVYVVGTKDDNNVISYDSISEDGKFVMMTYIAQASDGKMVFDMDGLVKEGATAPTGTPANSDTQAHNANGAVQEMPTGITTYMPESYYTSDLTGGSHAYKAKAQADNAIVGDLKVNPDNFAKVAADWLYNETLHSDTKKGEFKNSPHQAVYVMYDPNCPVCRREVPILKEAVESQKYPFIFVPVAALSPAPDPTSDDDFLYQLLAPHTGLQNILDSLKPKSSYQRPSGKLSDEQKQFGVKNQQTFLKIGESLKQYLAEKYQGDLSSYGTVADYAVPTMFYVNKQTGELHFDYIDYEALGLPKHE